MGLLKRRTVSDELFLDWAHEEEKIYAISSSNGKEPKNLSLKKLQALPQGTIIYGENMPPKIFLPLYNQGVKLFQVHTKDVKDKREELGVEKTHQNDCRMVKLLKEEGKFREWKPPSKLGFLYSSFKEIQKARNALGNRMFAAGETKDYEEGFDFFEKAEKFFLKSAAKELKVHKISEWLTSVKGVGPSMACGIISIFEKNGIGAFETVSSMWSYCGLGVVDGKAPRKTKGGDSKWNHKARAMLIGVLGPSFLKSQSSPYVEIYYDEKEQQLKKTYKKGELEKNYHGYEKEDTKLLLGHAHNRAMRKTVKIFISHLYDEWRKSEGLPVREPYCFEKLGHTTKI